MIYETVVSQNYVGEGPCTILQLKVLGLVINPQGTPRPFQIANDVATGLFPWVSTSYI